MKKIILQYARLSGGLTDYNFCERSLFNAIRVSTRLNPVFAQSFVDPNMGTNVCKVCGQTTLEGKKFH